MELQIEKKFLGLRNKERKKYNTNLGGCKARRSKRLTQNTRHKQLKVITCVFNSFKRVATPENFPVMTAAPSEAIEHSLLR